MLCAACSGKRSCAAPSSSQRRAQGGTPTGQCTWVAAFVQRAARAWLDRGSGLIASLAQSGGNVTGLSNLGSDLAAKRLGLLREVLPSVRRLAVMANAAAPLQRLSEITLSAMLSNYLSARQSQLTLQLGE
jgi:hypothetical protein